MKVATDLVRRAFSYEQQAARENFNHQIRLTSFDKRRRLG
ncbi:hypothetical protein ETAA8_11080 [Anatilimnocola aggregata]|uniref:Uncharacterized protein n=1 Tax=Anatilimnocola aggregata TaxID=2528021 RepID=A0A517Y750_9BACT|nr:hypothetical protein ETAA8_11080 [Anatilimnocola aggregata]